MKREEMQSKGLKETSTYIHCLIEEATAKVGAKNVILGGLSQGCAAALITMLTWTGEPIGAVFGMCGWLPFARSLEEIAIQKRDEDIEDDIFNWDDEVEGTHL